jgi:hypothetical protein
MWTRSIRRFLFATALLVLASMPQRTLANQNQCDIASNYAAYWCQHTYGASVISFDCISYDEDDVEYSVHCDNLAVHQGSCHQWWWDPFNWDCW